MNFVTRNVQLVGVSKGMARSHVVSEQLSVGRRIFSLVADQNHRDGARESGMKTIYVDTRDDVRRQRAENVSDGHLNSSELCESRKPFTRISYREAEN